jgi:SsrA-binding protein
LHISHYKQGNINNHDVTRSRKLLLHKRELRKLFSKITEKGFTLVPLKLYLKNGLVKIEIALCKGKKEYEKKESDKRRTENIKVKRIMKQHQSK